MSRTGDTYALPVCSWNYPVAGATIDVAGWTTLIDDIATALTQSLSRDGGSMLSPLKLASGSAAAPGLTFSADTDCGFYRSAADDIKFSLGGTDLVRFNTAEAYIYHSAAWRAIVTTGDNSTIAGTKTFSSSPVVPDLADTVNTTQAANTKYVRNQRAYSTMFDAADSFSTASQTVWSAGWALFSTARNVTEDTVNGTLTADIAGMYLIQLTGYMTASPSNETIEIEFQENGVDVSRSSRFYVLTANQAVSFQIQKAVNLSAGGVVRVTRSTIGGNNINFTNTEFSLIKIS